MWHTAEQLGLTPEEIDTIVEALWKVDLETSGGNCPDCNVKKGEIHHYGCDVDICPKCHHQVMTCEHAEPGVWDGLWPGTRMCKDLKLISTSSPTKILDQLAWTFDYNECARRRFQK